MTNLTEGGSQTEKIENWYCSPAYYRNTPRIGLSVSSQHFPLRHCISWECSFLVALHKELSLIRRNNIIYAVFWSFPQSWIKDLVSWDSMFLLNFFTALYQRFCHWDSMLFQIRCIPINQSTPLLKEIFAILWKMGDIFQ